MVTAGGKVIWGRYAQITVRFPPSLPPVQRLFPHHKCIRTNIHPPQEQLRDGRLRQRSSAHMKVRLAIDERLHLPRIGCPGVQWLFKPSYLGTRCILPAQLVEAEDLDTHSSTHLHYFYSRLRNRRVPSPCSLVLDFPI